MTLVVYKSPLVRSRRRRRTARRSIVTQGLGSRVRSLITRVRGRRDEKEKGGEEEEEEEEEEMRGGVLVAGASGRLGKEVVAELVARGRAVTAVSRSVPSLHSDVKVVQKCISALEMDDLEGIGQIVCCVGGSRETPPEQLEGSAVPALIAAAEAALGSTTMSSDAELTSLDGWRNLDDAIMGGSSSSAMHSVSRSSRDDGYTGCWKGDLIFQGGGFCGIRSPVIAAETASSRTDKVCGTTGSTEGIAFRMRIRNGGERMRLKATIKTSSNIDANEYAYQTSFIVTPNTTEIRLPLDSFVAVKKASTLSGAPPLRASEIRSVGFVYSRFEMNGLRNRLCCAGSFEIEMSAIRLFCGPLVQFVMVSSAGVERNILSANDEEMRRKEIPIVRLNPGGVLNWKYFAEMALRNSGLTHSVIRPTGLIEEEAAPAVPPALEYAQGDYISGRITRAEVARVVADVLTSGHALNTTFEVRRSEAGTTAPASFTTLCDDWSRARRGIRPFPSYQEAPPPPDEDTVKEIMEQVAVTQASR